VQQISLCNQILDQSGAVIACMDLVGNNWNCVNYVGMDSKSAHDRLTISCGSTGALFCCPIWAMIRCLLQQAKVNCGRVLADNHIPDTESMITFLAQYRQRQFQREIDQLHQNECVNFKFASPQCENVLTYIRNRELLEPIGKAS